jgi:hypothetical protein
MQPANIAEAMAMLNSALDHLNAADWEGLGSRAQGEVLAGLGGVESKLTALRGTVLGAFTAVSGFEADGHGSAMQWLVGQTGISKGAARGEVGWVKRLNAHRKIAAALAGGEVSESWGREIARWTDRLAAGDRDEADGILLGAASAGLPWQDIARLAAEILERNADQPDEDGPFRDRQVRLETTFGGAGRLTGDLSPACAAVLAQVFGALGKHLGPEDLRSEGERNHDALEEAGRRLIRSGMLPESVTPVVTGTVDWQAADAMTEAWIDAHGLEQRAPCGCTCGGCTCKAPAPLSPQTRARLSRTLLRLAADAMSGPGGLAGRLRQAPRPDATSTTSCPGPRAGPPGSKTSSFFVRITIRCVSTAWAGS